MTQYAGYRADGWIDGYSVNASTKVSSHRSRWAGQLSR